MARRYSWQANAGPVIMETSDPDGNPLQRGPEPDGNGEGTATDSPTRSSHAATFHHNPRPYLEDKEAAQDPTPPTPSPDDGEVHLHVVMRQSGLYRLRQPSSRLKLGAVLFASVVLLTAGWIFVRTYWNGIGSRTTAGVAEQQSNAKLNPPLICTGIGDNGAPEGVSESFTEDQVRNTGIAVFLTYSGAVPQKTTFQVRWTIEDRIYETKVQTLDHGADILYLKLGKEIPTGTHAFEFLVDGKVQQTANLIIGSPSLPSPPVSFSPPTNFQETPRPPTNPNPSPAPPFPLPAQAPSQVPPRPASQAASARTPPKPAPRPARSLPAQKEAVRPAEQVVVTAGAVAIPPVLTVQPEKPEKPAEPPPPVEVRVFHEARHWHSFGSCMGELKLQPESIEFTSDQHTFKFAIQDVSIDRDGILDPSGKTWHFLITGTDVEQVLGRWKRGELFPTAPREPGTQAAQLSQAPSGKAASAEAALKRAYAARHKHLLGSCSGELTLTPDAIEFSSQQHYCKYQVSNVQIERDGILDRQGNTWRFDIPGENVGELLRLWKAGKLFSSK